MNIGQAALQSGLAAKTVRYYELIGLVTPCRCEGNDYRDYSDVDVEHLRFLQQTRAVGFSLNVCRELLELHRDPERRSAEVKTLVLDKIHALDIQLQSLASLKVTLLDMANKCAENDLDVGSITHTFAAPISPLMPFMLVESSS